MLNQQNHYNMKERLAYSEKAPAPTQVRTWHGHTVDVGFLYEIQHPNHIRHLCGGNIFSFPPATKRNFS